jgi:1-deoxy-D-xylulose-5-phosphate reductoisomerase
MEPRPLALLGASGSIGRSTLAVVAAHPDKLRIVTLAARRNWRDLVAPARLPGVRLLALADPAAAKEARESGQFPGSIRIVSGPEGLVEAACHPEVRMVVSAIVGTAGLHPTLAAIRAGRDIALASKEILVLAGSTVTAEARARGVRLLPVDSEHNALHQLLRGKRPEEVERLVLTASGGPFRLLPLAELEKVTPEDALRHPNWSMGPKITVDSATMANKGLEVIEARWLFGLPEARIDVAIHPQSIIHAMVALTDGTLQAQLSPPSMAYPIQDCLLAPDRPPCPAPRLDLSQALSLELLPPDLARYPLLGLARAAARGAPAAPAVFNAANEVAVEAFLARRLPFTDIPRIVEQTLASTPAAADGLEAALEADTQARRTATALLR